MRDELSVRQWQEQFKAGAFDSSDFATQCRAGWYDWFCNDEALAGRLQKLARVVMGVTDPFILDNYYVWFKNNCPMNGPLYDDVRFEPLSGERDGKYFVVTLDSPHEKSKWALYTERNGFDKEHCGQDMDAFTQWLVDRLVLMGPEQAQRFHDISHGYQHLAYKYGLWNAASIMCNGCSDDGFIDFRGWLIAQGRNVYLAALKDPDSLADVPAYGGCCYESLSYAGDHAYEKLTGRSAYDNFDRSSYEALKEELKKDIVYGDGINYPYTWSETAAYLPKLCAKYMDPTELAQMIEHHNDTWNITSPDIQAARKTAQKSKKVQNRGESR